MTDFEKVIVFIGSVVLIYCVVCFLVEIAEWIIHHFR
jgi:hypothetical protein